MTEDPEKEAAKALMAEAQALFGNAENKVQGAVLCELFAQFLAKYPGGGDREKMAKYFMRYAMEAANSNDREYKQATIN